MTVPGDVLLLIERFQARRHEYMSPSYMEARVRVDFLNPFFRALGWDVENAAGLSEHERDVITEGRLQTSAGLKFPDYLFQVDGRPAFPVEAKKPSVNLFTDPAPAQQLRRYAWNANNLGVGIVTDFQEFSVYDCRIPPVGSDPATKARIDYLTIDDYQDRWDDIESRFSKDAVLDGSLQEYVDSKKNARGHLRVDKAFLKALENWREQLALDLARKNRLTQDEVNRAVQLIIDRIVFLRVAEDRSLERYRDLLDASSTRNCYGELQSLFDKADQKYNSGLFHFRDENGKPGRDTLTPGLKIDDAVLHPFIKSLYWPWGPYDFKLFPSDVLGQVYEQFLGSVIHLTSPRAAEVTVKPEVRKSKGVYYTPTHVVTSIVDATLEPLLARKTPASLERDGLFVCDPSCGSGSFLIEVYQYLLDWHLDAYLRAKTTWGKKVKGREARIHKTTTGEWRLTTAERKRILLAHVFGVDIDAQAVEVTKLALLLKVLEGETEASLYEQTALFHDRVLPNLDDNVRCGNSLVGNAIHFSPQTSLDEEFERRVNAFDWDLEFPNVTAERGFDAIVGNPPWLMAGYYVADATAYLKDNFDTATGKFDLYYLFMEQSLRLLTPGGRLGMIVPNKFFHTKAARTLRELLLAKADLEQVRDFGTEKVFAGATNYSCILIARNAPPTTDDLLYESLTVDLDVSDSFGIRRELLQPSSWHFQDEVARTLFDRLEHRCVRLETLTERFGTGVQTGADKVMTMTPEQADGLKIEPDLRTAVLRGRDVRAYSLSQDHKELLFPYRSKGNQFQILDEIQLAKYQRGFAYLNLNRAKLAGRVWFGQTAEELSGQWFGLMYLERRAYLTRPHLLTPSLSKECNFAIGDGSLFVTGTAGVTSVVTNPDVEPRFLLGVLNSPVVRAYVHGHSPVFQGGYRKFSANYLKPIPVPSSGNTASARRRRADIAAATDQVLTLTSRLHAGTTDDETNRIQRQLSAARRASDDLVMEAYGLDRDERRWVLDRSSQ